VGEHGSSGKLKQALVAAAHAARPPAGEDHARHMKSSFHLNTSTARGSIWIEAIADAISGKGLGPASANE
jgi:hypothetical protein